MVRQTGLEPVTLDLEGPCSIQLSYRGISPLEQCWEPQARLQSV